MIGNRQEETRIREEAKALHRDYVLQHGQLPQGFSAPYDKEGFEGYVLRRTPFEAYLEELRYGLDELNNVSRISDWLFFDGSVEINEAVMALAAWVSGHRHINKVISQMCRTRFGILVPPISYACREKVMVVMEDRAAFAGITAGSRALCEAENIGFCTLLSDRQLYDLMEGKKKTVCCSTYPNYHDETHGDWDLI